MHCAQYLCKQVPAHAASSYIICGRPTWCRSHKLQSHSGTAILVPALRVPFTLPSARLWTRLQETLSGQLLWVTVQQLRGLFVQSLGTAGHPGKEQSGVALAENYRHDYSVNQYIYAAKTISRVEVISPWQALKLLLGRQYFQ